MDVWKAGRNLRNIIYDIADKLPNCEKYGLCGQMRRAAVSVTSNIAEGYGRFHFKETIQFARHARGSVYEINDHLITCLDQGYIEKEVFDKICKEQINRVLYLINGYIRHLNDKTGTGTPN